MSEVDYQPTLHILMPFTTVKDTKAERAILQISVAVARAATAAGYSPYLPWSTDYTDDPNDSPKGLAYEQEKRRLLTAQIAVDIEAAASRGAGRLLEVADQNLIPVIVVRPRNVRISRVGRGQGYSLLPGKEIVIDEPWEVEQPLRNLLEEVRSDLDFRKSTWPPRHEPPVCASLIKNIRENHVGEGRTARGGMSQSTLAERLGLPVEMIAAVEKGAIVPSLYLLRVFAKELGVPPSALTHPGFEPSDSKTRDEPRIVEFWVKNDLGIAKLRTFLAFYDNRGLRDRRPPTDEELWTDYKECFGEQE